MHFLFLFSSNIFDSNSVYYQSSGRSACFFQDLDLNPQVVASTLHFSF